MEDCHSGLEDKLPILKIYKPPVPRIDPKTKLHREI